jgi:hypothetical protein
MGTIEKQATTAMPAFPAVVFAAAVWSDMFGKANGLL